MIEVVIVASKDDLDAGWQRAQSLYNSITPWGGGTFTSRLINKLSFSLDDLEFVAVHKVVTTPTIIFLRDGEGVARRLGLLSPREVTKLIQRLNKPTM